MKSDFSMSPFTAALVMMSKMTRGRKPLHTLQTMGENETFISSGEVIHCSIWIYAQVLWCCVIFAMWCVPLQISFNSGRSMRDDQKGCNDWTNQLTKIYSHSCPWSSPEQLFPVKHLKSTWGPLIHWMPPCALSAYCAPHKGFSALLRNEWEPAALPGLLCFCP